MRLILLLSALVVAAVLMIVVRSLPKGEVEVVPPQRHVPLTRPPLESEPQTSDRLRYGPPPPPGKKVDPGFYFLYEMNRDEIASNLNRFDVPFEKLPQPQGMDADVSKLCDLILDADVTLKELMRVSSSELGAVIDAGFTKGGEYLVTLGPKLVVWRAATGEKVREHALPVADAKQLLVGANPATAVLVSDQALAKVSLVDGRVVERLAIEPGIERACIARDDGKVGICTKAMQCCLVSSDLKQQRLCGSVKLSSPAIAIAPNGRALLFIVNNKATRWLLKENLVEHLEGNELQPELAIAVAATDHDYFLDDFEIYEYDEEEMLSPVPNNRTPIPMYLNTRAAQVIATETNGGDSLLLVARQRPGQAECLRVFDVQPLSFAASNSAVVSQHPDARVYASPSADRLAVLDADGLRVVQRRPWVGIDEKMWARQVASLFMDGRFDQVEMVGNYIRQHKHLPSHETGEAQFATLARHIASAWHLLEQRQSEELLKQADAWKDSKSALAVVASALRHIYVGGEARGGGVSSTVTEEGWRIYLDRFKRAEKELNELPKDSVGPAIALEVKLTLFKGLSTPLGQANQVLQTYMLNYPLESGAHEIVCTWCLPRWSGHRGQSGAYLDAVTGLYPAAYSGDMYARIGTRFKSDQVEVFEGEFGIDDARMQAALNALATRSRLTKSDLERAMSYEPASGQAFDCRLLAERHLRDYDIVGEAAYTTNAINGLTAARSR